MFLNLYPSTIYFFIKMISNYVWSRKKKVQLGLIFSQVHLFAFCHDQCWLNSILPIIHELSWVFIYFSVQVCIIKFEFSQKQGNELKEELRRTGDKQMDTKRILSLKLVWCLYPAYPKFHWLPGLRLLFTLMSFGFVNVFMKAFPANSNVQ